MPDHFDILNPQSPWRIDVRRDARARDQDLIDAAAGDVGRAHYAVSQLLAEICERHARMGWQLQAERQVQEDTP